MEYCGYCIAKENIKLEVRDELVYGNKKMIIHEIRKDGTMTFDVRFLENGKWLMHHQTKEYIKLVADLEARNNT